MYGWSRTIRTKGTVSRQIDNAVSAGPVTVQPSPHSRRENAVFLTPAGTDLVRRGDTAFHRDRAAILPIVDPDDMHAVIRVLTVMNNALSTHRDVHR
ncbi:MarR family winged helix-turn-helix transcriptional regulator [Streptomyces sp. NPDC002536]